MSGTVLVVSVRAVLDACAALGHDADEIAARAGVDRALLRDPDARIAASQVEAVWRAAGAVTNDPALALHAAEAAPDGAYQVLDYLGAASATLGEAITRLSRYFSLLGQIELSVARRARQYRLTLASTLPGVELPPPAQEYTLAALVLRTRLRCGVPWVPTHVDFTFAGTSTKEHTRVFGVPPRWRRPTAGLGISLADWSRPSIGADPGLASLLEDHAKLVVDRLPRGGVTARQVVEAVHGSLKDGEPTLTAIARRLATSARTLQRRLEDEGTSLAAIVRAERERLAKEHLELGQVSLAELAFLLGFADQSSFTRAFRRWTGMTPARFRAALGRDPERAVDRERKR